MKQCTVNVRLSSTCALQFGYMSEGPEQTDLSDMRTKNGVMHTAVKPRTSATECKNPEVDPIGTHRVIVTSTRPPTEGHFFQIGLSIEKNRYNHGHTFILAMYGELVPQMVPP